MITKFKTILAGLALAAVSATASATVWTSTYDPTDVRVPPTQTWQHDLTLNGFNAGVDAIDSFTLAVTVRDDSDFLGEWAWANIPGSIYFGSSLNILGYTLSAINIGGFELFGSLNFLQDGKMDVVLSSNGGDFIFDKSVLKATGTSGQVPEPGALALVGLGLAGLALARRRQHQK